MKTQKNAVPSNGEVGYMYRPYQMPNLEGQLLTFIETLGLRETQEKAAKDILRQTIWRWCAEVSYVPPELVQKVFEFNSLPNTPQPNRR